MLTWRPAGAAGALLDLPAFTGDFKGALAELDVLQSTWAVGRAAWPHESGNAGPSIGFPIDVVEVLFCDLISHDSSTRNQEFFDVIGAKSVKVRLICGVGDTSGQAECSDNKDEICNS